MNNRDLEKAWRIVVCLVLGALLIDVGMAVVLAGVGFMAFTTVAVAAKVNRNKTRRQC